MLLDGPHGAYTPAYPEGNFLLIAAGIGITPIMSLLRTAVDRGDRQRFTLVYGNRRWEDITFRDELELLESALDLKVCHVLSQPPPDWKGQVGRIRGEILQGALGASARPLNAFVCGPSVMVDGCVEVLEQLGIAESEIHAERFTSA